MPQDTLKNGTQVGVVAAKGSGEYGAVAHYAFELQRDPEIGQKELRIVLQKGRNTGMSLCYAEFDEDSGKVLRYKGTADWFGGGGAAEVKPAPKRGGKK